MIESNTPDVLKKVKLDTLSQLKQFTKVVGKLLFMT